MEVEMKKILKSFTFWSIILSAFVIWQHQIGRDSKSIILISLNPILNALAGEDITRTFMNSGPRIHCNTILGEISIYWYLASFLTFVAVGSIIDLIRYVLRKFQQVKS